MYRVWYIISKWYMYHRMCMAVMRSLLARHDEARPFPPQHEMDAIGAVASHTITVTNTGAIDADDVVLSFVKAPGAGLGGVPSQSLYDF